MTNSHTEIIQEPPQAMEGQDTVFKCVKCDLEIANSVEMKRHVKKPHR